MPPISLLWRQLPVCSIKKVSQRRIRSGWKFRFYFGFVVLETLCKFEPASSLVDAIVGGVMIYSPVIAYAILTTAITTVPVHVGALLLSCL